MTRTIVFDAQAFALDDQASIFFFVIEVPLRRMTHVPLFQNGSGAIALHNPSTIALDDQGVVVLYDEGAFFR